MIDFTTLQGLTIPEGVATQITDESGRVIWAVQSESGEPIVLEVEKITSDTYAGETTYTGEQFILLDIYPKTNGTVNVTYGGLTKTITDTSGAAEPNAQQVFFGTFNGVSDSVETPASGTLAIKGDYAGFGCSLYTQSKSSSLMYWVGIKKVTDFGVAELIPELAFGNLTYPSDTVTDVVLPETLKYIGKSAFGGCVNLASVTFENPNGWKAEGTDAMGQNQSFNLDGKLNDPTTNVTLLQNTYIYYTWYHS